MNFQSAYIILTLLIFVKLKSSEAKRVKFKKGSLPAGTRSKYHRYRLNSPQFNYYYNLLSDPYLKRQFINLIKNKKRLHDDPFVDLTRDDIYDAAQDHGTQNKFSDDYIDFSELARHTKTPIDDNKATYKIKPERNNKQNIDVDEYDYTVLKLLDRVARRTGLYKQRSNAFESDTSESNSETDSEDTSDTTKTGYLKDRPLSRYNPKRFQVINNYSEESKSDGDEDDEKAINVSIDTISDTDSDKNIQVISNSESSSVEETSDGFIYIQSPTRHMKTRDMEWRRRLKHFLPKRVHWYEREFQDLRNYWIDGPRGRYPAQQKTPY